MVIKHWKIHNYIQSDRFKPTVYREERAELKVKDNKSYTKKSETVEIPTMYTECIQDGDTGKVRLGKSKDKDIYGEFKNVRLTPEEFKKLKERFPDFNERIEALSEYMRSKGKTYRDHYATILSWARKEERENKDKPKPPEPKKYKQFEKEEWEKDDFKSAEMPAEIREKLGGLFNAG